MTIDVTEALGLPMPAAYTEQEMAELAEEQLMDPRPAPPSKAFGRDYKIPTDVDGMRRFYHLAKRQAWDVRQLSWGELAPVPEARGSAEKQARRLAMWRSVVTQQLQADMIAVQCSVQLLTSVPDPDARLYYSTMTTDEARHTESWLLLSDQCGGVGEPDPFLAQLGELVMKVDTLEEQVFLFQCAFEGLVIPRFHQIASAAPNTILAEICTRLAIDDGIHHGSGVCYENQLLAGATAKTKRKIERSVNEMWPLYVQHLTWRPRERAIAASMMHAHDEKMIARSRDEVLKMGTSFGLELDFQM